MKSSPDIIAELITEAGLDQRQAVRALLQEGVRITETQFREYCNGTTDCPDDIWQALNILVNRIREKSHD